MDGVSHGDKIANVYALKLKVFLNTHSFIPRDSLLSSIQSSLTGSHLHCKKCGVLCTPGLQHTIGVITHYVEVVC